MKTLSKLVKTITYDAKAEPAPAERAPVPAVEEPAPAPALEEAADKGEGEEEAADEGQRPRKKAKAFQGS
tara:strand:+ start:627 stop:836 length:210 start_codon:yes stop_codon:yes gene_type:complete